ncbi:MAG TPA: hypothetical protein VGP94_13895, partial [Tepidisphaeraceae bacterium]|nr:hypothetical protein [Tepidisphaeraceae bacterium]
EKGNPRDWSLIELNEKRFILAGHYKLNQNGNLFDLSDPAEEKPIDTGTQSPQAAEMRKKLADLLASIPRGKKETGNVNE